MKKHKIKVYSTQTCPYCTMAKDFIKKKGCKYEDFDVSTDKKAAKEAVAKSGQYGVPVIDIDGKVVIGFDQDKIEELLN
ncbi:MAG: glutaredoxin domain-containing protein [archaeon]